MGSRLSSGRKPNHPETNALFSEHVPSTQTQPSQPPSMNTDASDDANTTLRNITPMYRWKTSSALHASEIQIGLKPQVFHRPASKARLDTT